jgi:DNA polymerase-3 subunit gamma/tau
VLARKWRPQTFRDLIGQEHVSQTLKNAIDAGRVAHAFLFTGARGVGKTSSARILAKALNCNQGPAPEPCNSCPSCAEITSGNSVDVFEIDGASNTGVDDIRELRENVKYLPSRSRFKIFIIDEVHMLSTSAFNALLKTLEEPPPHVKFIFATTEPHKVPITILSRCQRFDFRRISLAMIIAQLRHIVAAEGIAVSDAALAMVARKGDGSMRDSLSTLDQILAFCGDSVSDDTVVALLGVIDRRLLLQTVRSIVRRDCRDVLDIVRQVDSYGYNVRTFCQELLDLFRTMTIIKAVGTGADLPDMADGELAEIGELLQDIDLVALQRHLTILLKAEGELHQSAMPRLVLELALIKMATLVPLVPVTDLIERLKVLEGKVSSGLVASAPPAWNRTPAHQAADAARHHPAREQRPPEPEHQSRPQTLPPGGAREDAPAGESRWDGFVTFVRSRKRLLASILEHGRPLVFNDRQVHIGFDASSFQLKQVQDQGMGADLRKLGNEYFRTEIDMKIVPLSGTSEDTPPSLAEKKSHEIASRRQRLEEQAGSHPLVAAALEIFGGEITAIEEPKPPS